MFSFGVVYLVLYSSGCEPGFESPFWMSTRMVREGRRTCTTMYCYYIYECCYFFYFVLVVVVVVVVGLRYGDKGDGV